MVRHLDSHWRAGATDPAAARAEPPRHSPTVPHGDTTDTPSHAAPRKRLSSHDPAAMSTAGVSGSPQPRPPSKSRGRGGRGARGSNANGGPSAHTGSEGRSLARSGSPFKLPPIVGANEELGYAIDDIEDTLRRVSQLGENMGLAGYGEGGGGGGTSATPTTGFARFQETLQKALRTLGGNQSLDALWQLLSQILTEMMQRGQSRTQLQLTERYCGVVSPTMPPVQDPSANGAVSIPVVLGGTPPPLPASVDTPGLCAHLDCILSFCTSLSPTFRHLAENVRRQLHALIFVSPPQLSNLPDAVNEDDLAVLRRVYAKFKTFKALLGHRKAADEPRMNVVVRTLRQRAAGVLRVHMQAWREVCVRNRMQKNMDGMLAGKAKEIESLKGMLQEAKDKIASLELALKHQRMRTFTEISSLKASYDEQLNKIKERNLLLTHLSDEAEAKRVELDAQCLTLIEKLRSRDVEYQTDYERAKSCFDSLLPSSSPDIQPEGDPVRTQLIALVRKGGTLDEIMADWVHTRCEGLWESISEDEANLPPLFGVARTQGRRSSLGAVAKLNSEATATFDLKATLLLIHTMTSCKVTPAEIEDCACSADATELLMEVTSKLGVMLPIASFTEFKTFVMLRLAALATVAKAVLIPGESDSWLVSYVGQSPVDGIDLRTGSEINLRGTKPPIVSPVMVASHLTITGTPRMTGLDADAAMKMPKGIIQASLKALVEARLTRSNAYVKRERRRAAAIATVDALMVAKHTGALMEHRDLQRQLVMSALPANLGADPFEDDDTGPVIWAHPGFNAVALAPLSQITGSKGPLTPNPRRDLIPSQDHRAPRGSMFGAKAQHFQQQQQQQQPLPQLVEPASSPKGIDIINVGGAAGLRYPSTSWTNALRDHIQMVLGKYYTKLADIFTFYCVGQRMGKLDVASFLRDCKMWQDSADSTGFGRRKTARLPGGGTDLLRVLGVSDQTQLDLNGFLSLVVAMSEYQAAQGASWTSNMRDEGDVDEEGNPVSIEVRGPVGFFVEEHVLPNALSCDMMPLVDALKSKDVENVVDNHKRFLARIFLAYADTGSNHAGGGARKRTARRKSQNLLFTSYITFTACRKLMEESRLTDESVSYLTIQQVYQKVAAGSSTFKHSQGLSHHEFILLIFIISGYKYPTPYHPWAQKLSRYITLWISRAPQHFVDPTPGLAHPTAGRQRRKSM